MTTTLAMEILRVMLATVYVSVVIAWLCLTAYFLTRLIYGIRHRQETHQYLFPLWRKQGQFSGSAMWVWIVIPSCLFLMFLLPIFPNEVTKLISVQGAFWTSIITAVISVLTNYYLGKRLTQTSVELKTTPPVVNPNELPGKPGQPGVTSESPPEKTNA